MRPNSKILTFLYGCTIFLSAFLLFQVQPLIGKMLLPRLGGAAAVWSTCLLFFQVLLLLGYLYAHLSSTYLSPRKQAWLHVFLMAMSIAMLPIMPDPPAKLAGGEDPTLLLIALLAWSIGLPYFVLSTTGPLLQTWFAREKTGAVPYRLFALSNFGSMLGLLSYPAVFESRLSMRNMSLIWSIAYAVFVLLCAILALRGTRRQTAVRADPSGMPPARPAAGSLVLWASLAAYPAILLMAVTSHLTQNVAPVPFLWVLPLSLYLATFIFCFEGGNWYRRKWYLPAFIFFLGAMNYDLVSPVSEEGVALPIALYCIGLFVSCMLCHGELARRKPHPDYLTSFYLMVALGGALGGTFVAIVAPRIFDSNYELSLATLAIAITTLTLVHGEAIHSGRRRASTRAVINAMAAGVALISIASVAGTARQHGAHRLLARNFYGTLTIEDVASEGHVERQLSHGATLHGSQYRDKERRRWPTTYYGDNGGAGMAVLATRKDGQQQRVGIIGLGAGTMAAYGRAGDYYRFYEINPLVADLARTQFTYLKDCPALVETVIGDARLSLEAEPPHYFDVLVVDAFSGDSIPVHLLTREAFALYLRHMRPGGILAVHISNRNLDLAPVVKHASDYYRKEARIVESEDDDDRGLTSSSWVLISDRADVFASKPLRESAGRIELVPMVRPWTDDYSSIYAVLK